MKILFLSDDFSPYSFGGAGIAAYNLAKEIRAKGHEIFVITTVKDKSKEGNEIVEKLNIFKIYSNYNERWRAWLSLYNCNIVKKVRKIIKQINPDVVHAHNIHYHLSYESLKIAKKYSKAVFLTAHDVMLVHYGKLIPKNGSAYYKISTKDQIKEAGKRYNPFRNLIIRHYLKYADKIFAVSDAVKKALEINGIKNIETIHNGIDVGEWVMNPEEIEKFKNRYGLENKKIILFGGRLSSAKGGEVILRAIKKISEELGDVVLLIAGKEDYYAQKMKKFIGGNNISDKVVFTGWLDRKQMKTAVFSSDICLTPSICFDSFPTANLEAMMSKKPVVGTCFGGTSEIVVNNKTGYIVNPLNINELVEKIIDLLKNPQKVKQFGEAGYERVKKYFSSSQQADKTLEYYQKYI